MLSLKHITGEQAQNMLMYVQQAGSFSCGDTYVAKRRKYDSILLISTLAGKGVLKYRNRTYVLEKGMGFIIDCNEPQVYFTMKDNTWSFIWVHFKGGKGFEQVRFILENSGPVFKHTKNSAINSNIYRILGMGDKKGIGCDIRISQYLNEIMTELMLKSLEDELKEGVLPEIVANAVSIMEAEYADRLRLDEIAHRLFIDKYSLIKKFKRYIGVTPYEYLVKYRINRSKLLLENSSFSVSEIAQRVGFEDPSYFIKSFKQHEKITPLAYRKIQFKTNN